ncbi:hypothetical protein BD560DRAFT_384289 [Blakeslea trispora]|nr:hypothetical protein BD560DRAFT_384289 [Blakeslea trispora]
MSTFAFVPSRTTYANRPQSMCVCRVGFERLTKLYSRGINASNVWSDSRLIHRIQLSAEEKASEIEDEEWQEKQYELERLKALVPKTKKKPPMNNSNHQRKPTKLNNRHIQTTKKSVPVKTPSKRQNTPVNIPEEDSSKTPTKEEQRRFFHFLQSWTSTHILPHTSLLNKDNFEHFHSNNESCFHHEPFPINTSP